MAERLVRERIFFFLLIGVLVILTLLMLWPFLGAILLAVAVAVILKPLYNWFLKKKWMKESENRAAGATIITFVLVIAIPTFFILGSAASQAARFFGGLDAEVQTLHWNPQSPGSKNSPKESLAKGFRSTTPRSRRPFRRSSVRSPSGPAIW